MRTRTSDHLIILVGAAFLFERRPLKNGATLFSCIFEPITIASYGDVSQGEPKFGSPFSMRQQKGEKVIPRFGCLATIFHFRKHSLLELLIN